MDSSSSDIVSTSTAVPGSVRVIWRVAPIPLAPGRLRSISTTSGRQAWAARTARSAVSAWATIVMFSTVSIKAARPSRTTGWSSTTKRVITLSPPYPFPKGSLAKTRPPDGIGPAQSWPPTSLARREFRSVAPRGPRPTTEDAGRGWTVVRCSLGELIQHAVVRQDDAVGSSRVSCRRSGNGTEVTVSYDLTALTPDANDELEQFVNKYPSFLGRWGQSIVEANERRPARHQDRTVRALIARRW